MNGSVELTLHQAGYLPTLFFVADPNRWRKKVERITENPHTECKLKPMLEAVGLVLGRIELELHCL